MMLYMEKIKRLANRNRICQYIINLFFLLYSGLFAALCFCMRIFPIQENKIVCCNMKGKRYGDNPKYITEELLKRKLNYQIVWILNDNVVEGLPQGVRRVKNNAFAQAYELATAGIWIDSNTKQYGTLKRKKQLYIQTWHGSYGLKKVYGDILDKISFIDKILIQYNSRIIDLYISNSMKTSEIYRRAFWYRGEILECGSPRNDIFFEDSQMYREKVERYFEVKEKKMVLYAPTYRKNRNTNAFQLDYDKLRNSLQERFGGEWVVLIRLHPVNIVDAECFMKYDKYVINATEYSVMQELLAACDILVTDYSSCMFDFATKYKKCFLYATDIAEYEKERDVYFKLEELPFPVAYDNGMLCDVIMNFDEKKYNNELDKLFEQVGLCENGHASRCVADYIEQWRKDKKKS